MECGFSSSSTLSRLFKGRLLMAKILPNCVVLFLCQKEKTGELYSPKNIFMRKLKLQMQVSLDLYISDVRSGMNWMIWPYNGPWAWDEELRKYHTDMTASYDTILLGWDMADGGFIDHWAGIAKEKDNPQQVFAANATAAHKVVFSRKKRQSRWENATTTTEDLATEIKRLKQQPGKDLIVYGGASFAGAVARTGFIDEYHFVVNPAILGQGVSIFSKIDNILTLSPVSARVYACGITVLVYQPR
jgi:dihydrofolate reductase